MSKKVKHQALAKCTVVYLGCGSADGKNYDAAQGTDFLQVPLRQRYNDRAKDTGAPGSLTVFSSGVYMQRTDGSVTVTWFPIKTLMVAAALRYIDRESDPVSGDKFVALDEDRTVGGRNPPIFVLAIRRQSDMNMIDCHIFITKNETAAMALVQSCIHAYNDKDGWTDAMPPAQLIEEELKKVKTISKHQEKLSTWNQNRALPSQFVAHSKVGQAHVGSYRVSAQHQKPTLAQIQRQKGGTVSSAMPYRHQKPSVMQMQYPNYPNDARHRMGHQFQMQPPIAEHQFPQQPYDPRIQGMRAPHPYWTISHAGYMGYPTPNWPQGGPMVMQGDSKKTDNESKESKGSKSLKNLFKPKDKSKDKAKDMENHKPVQEYTNMHRHGTGSRSMYQDFDYARSSSKIHEHRVSDDHGDRIERPKDHDQKRDTERYRDGYKPDYHSRKDRREKHERSDHRRDSRRHDGSHLQSDESDDYDDVRYHKNHGKSRDSREYHRSKSHDAYRPQMPRESEPDPDYEVQRVQQKQSRPYHPEISYGSKEESLAQNKRVDYNDDEYMRRREDKKEDIEKLARALAEHRIMNKTPPIDYEISTTNLSNVGVLANEVRGPTKSPPADYDGNKIRSRKDVQPMRSTTPPADYEEIDEKLKQVTNEGKEIGQKQNGDGPPVRHFNDEIILRAKQMNENRAKSSDKTDGEFRWPYQ